MQKCQELAEMMVKLGKIYSELALPLRMGFLSLLSSKKISILDKQIQKLLETIQVKQKEAKVINPARYFDEGDSVIVEV